MYVNCVYCGHRYGPNDETPTLMADVLREHIEQCPEHPLSAAMKTIAELRKQLDDRPRLGDGHVMELHTLREENKKLRKQLGEKSQ